MNREFFHAGFIAQDGAVATLATGVNSQHRQLGILIAQHMLPKHVDRRTLACARHTRDADATRLAGVWQAFLNHLLSNDLMVGI